MERIYSAFFTNERRQEIELTAEALEKHNEKQSQVDLQELQAHREARNPQGDRDEEEDDERDEQALALTGRRLQQRQDAATRALLRQELKSAVKAALKAFLYAYGAKAFTAMLMASRKWSSIEYGYADAVRLLLRADTIRFGAFSGSLVGLFRITEIVMRLARGKKDATNLAVAGGVSGLALLIDSPSRRSTVAVYILVRMLDVLGRQLTADGVLPKYKYSSECLFALCNAIIMYAVVVDHTLLPKGYYQWILRVGCMNHEGLEYTFRRSLRGELGPDGKPLPFRICQPHYHMESCVTHGAKEWVNGLGRSLQIYLPVHFLPALIFRFNQLKNAPLTSTAKVSYAALCSSAFLTSYQTTGKLALCVLRNTMQRDSPIQGLFAGAMAGTSLFFEDPKRRLELMLYCFPRALDVVWKVLQRRRLVRYVRHSEVVLFCMSMAIIMSRPSQHFKPTYLRIIRFIFGGNVL
ncbi:TPA: hypothetical protein N0F65_011595 [Lagenidium giganteum]|uniref:Transmembrane protein 135 N-terminal domain-containing protein n=1 Tax=Lagenidium giganteum TaxID=4803 RepID=A0AAV2Z7A3_9STRA|nr:TPA: hypothetical protein N0F65_011595 [Lagenidium giganteum]